MTNDVRPPESPSRPSRRTLRLTFRVASGEVQLLSKERLEMICPPSIGDRPQAGRHSGFWMELRDANERVLFHRLLHSPLANSVEVHSPDGKIRREFGEPVENIFEVLVPDVEGARTIAMMGESLTPPSPKEAKATESREGEAGSRELVRFDLSQEVRDERQ
jgi:hypothetical protein